MWADGWDWTKVQHQIDLTHALGANTWRMLGSVYAVTSGMITRATYLSRQTQIAAYVASLGGWYFPTGFDGSGSDIIPTATQIHDELVALGTALAPYSANICGFDIANEDPGWTISNNTLLADIKATLPGIPFTSSCSEGTMITDDTFRATLDPYVDFFDQHLYAGATQPTTIFDALFAATAKPIVIGEFGKPGSTSDVGISNYYGSIGAIASRILNTGRGIAGYLAWSAWDGIAPSTGDNDTTTFGLYRNDFTERTKYTTPYKAMPTA